ncbi:hypothetical protein IE985_20335 [Klebsiella pneumoniae]|nr:hypothetical protein [Klebsiella pneumoniae]
MGTTFTSSPRLSATSRAISASLPSRVLLSSAKTVSGGEFRAATATVNFPGTARCRSCGNRAMACGFFAV